uniref:Uncharacterized protein n=1 Tax=Salix viminalis TaxID=40686 RepID=A0A6N2LCH9_SALVM
MSYYSRAEADRVDDYDEYDPTPYGGGYDIVLTYGQPIPPSDDTCHPIKSSSQSDEIDYDRPNYSSHSEPSAYADEALETEYSSYSRPKPRPGSTYGGPQPDNEFQPGSAYGSAGYEKPAREQYGSSHGSAGYEKPAREEYGSSHGSAGYGKPQSEEYGSGGYEKSSDDSGYGRRPEYEDGSGYEKPSKA